MRKHSWGKFRNDGGSLSNQIWFWSFDWIRCWNWLWFISQKHNFFKKCINFLLSLEFFEKNRQHNFHETPKEVYLFWNWQVSDPQISHPNRTLHYPTLWLAHFHAGTKSHPPKNNLSLVISNEFGETPAICDVPQETGRDFHRWPSSTSSTSSSQLPQVVVRDGNII